MTNLEFYKDDIKKKIKNGENFVCAICQTKNKNCPQCSADDGDDILCNVVDWLLEERDKKIRLKQWEYDLMWGLEEGSKFHDWGSLCYMKRKGYFKGITDTTMKIGYILNNCEVIE